MTYEEYEKLCKEQQEKNKLYLDLFQKDLITAGLSQKTIKQHMNNVNFYINDYLLKEEPLEMSDGCGVMLDMFMGYFFIYKCLWSTPYTIKTTAASIKKFYKCMHAHGYVSKDSYIELCDIIKDSMEEWQDSCRAFNDF